MKPYRPCDTCGISDTCELRNGCHQWRAYFRAYWRELRKLMGVGM